VANGYGVSNNLLYLAGKKFQTKARQMEEFKLVSTTQIGLAKKGYHMEAGKEWNLNRTFYNQAQNYLPIALFPAIGRQSGTVTLLANWIPNIYGIFYDPNGGSGSMAQSIMTYDVDGSLQSSAFTYDNHSFKGWNTRPDGRGTDFFEGQEVRNLTTQDNGSITLYALWDQFPKIEAPNRYFTLAEEQEGKITEERLLERVIGRDLEDGILENGKSISLISYEPQKGIATYEARDSFGNCSRKTADITIVDTGGKESTGISYPRYISPEFYKATIGGLEQTSIWKSEEAYQRALEHAMENRKGQKEALEEWNFTTADRELLKEFVNQNGFGRCLNPDAVIKFYHEFSQCLMGSG
jgi:hypothetical protein